jgi:hypothetical protein
MPTRNPIGAIRAIVAGFMTLCSGANAGPEPAAPPLPAPSAAELMADVVARLPQQPLQVHGDIIVRRRHGIVDQSFKFDMLLRWGSAPAEACYTIRDAFGNPLEQMTVRRTAGGAPEFHYAVGDPPAPAQTPGLFGAVQDTDVSWTDLSLSFFWWRNGTVVATNEVRGRRCYVVEVPAPPSAARETAPGEIPPYASVRLWIDAEIRMLLQAEGLNASGRTVRRLWVKSFKKVNDTWMIKDLEIQEVNSGRRTRLTVLEVNGTST